MKHELVLARIFECKEIETWSWAQIKDLGVFMCLFVVLARIATRSWPNLAKMSKICDFPKHEHIRDDQ